MLFCIKFLKYCNFIFFNFFSFKISYYLVICLLRVNINNYCCVVVLNCMLSRKKGEDKCVHHTVYCSMFNWVNWFDEVWKVPSPLVMFAETSLTRFPVVESIVIFCALSSSALPPTKKNAILIKRFVWNGNRLLWSLFVIF